MANTIKRNIPNCITLCNLLCGTIAAQHAVRGNLQYAAIFIALGILFDFFDGMVARLLKVSSPMGKELDSLADLVTSGIAPGFILFHIMQDLAKPSWLSYIALLIPLAAAWRLAKFNLDIRQTSSFRGLPAPANALVWVTLGLIYCCPECTKIAILSISNINSTLFSENIGTIILTMTTLICSWLMVSNIPLFALKFKNLKWSENKLRFIFLITSALLIVTFGITGILFAILCYIILSLIGNRSAKT